MNLQATSVDMSDSLRPDEIDIAESDHVQQKPLQPAVVDELETLAKWLVEGESSVDYKKDHGSVDTQT